jgi:hypothetical protein
MKTLNTLVSGAFYVGLSYFFMHAWVQVTPAGVGWVVAGLTVSGLMCALLYRS